MSQETNNLICKLHKKQGYPRFDCINCGGGLDD